MEAEQKRHDELKRQAEAAKETERSAKYQLALGREEERKMVSGSSCAVSSCKCLAGSTTSIKLLQPKAALACCCHLLLGWKSALSYGLLTAAAMLRCVVPFLRDAEHPAAR